MTSLITKARILILFVFLLNLIACGEPQGGNEIDELESSAPDVGFNVPMGRDPASGEFSEEELTDQPKVCLGKVTTQSSNLNIRSGPSTGSPVCGSIPSKSYMTVLNPELQNGFYQVTSDFCSSGNQFVFGTYVQLGDDCNNAGEETPLPPSPPSENPKTITDLRSYIKSNYKKVSVVRELTRGGSKGLVEVYKLPGQGENIMCGIKHIRSYRSEPYQGIDTMCAWTAVAQEWRKQYCPDNSPDCRIMLGDSSFGERMPSSWPHSTHRRGWCMDIWPMRKDNCGEVEVTWKQSCYSREKTTAFVKLLIKHGADKGNQLFFNDPQVPDVRYLSNHDDHVHACFKPANSIVKTRCEDTVVDTGLCHEL